SSACSETIHPCFFFLSCYADLPDLPSFPTRRSSDLAHWTRHFSTRRDRSASTTAPRPARQSAARGIVTGRSPSLKRPLIPLSRRDRKSTRLNSSHSQISYAVFCLKKKKNKNKNTIYT